MVKAPLHDIKNKILSVINQYPMLELCFIFGSFAKGRITKDSDIDIAVASEKKIDYELIAEIETKLDAILHCDIDLIDLQAVSGMILKKAISKGIPVMIKDKQLYADIIKRMLYNQADMMPYYTRILKQRREKFLHG